jgi:2-oxoglutarate ferredoxin oxidoreductase subunit beta
LNSVQKALAELGKRPHEVLCVSGIGCSSNFPGYLNAYGMHTLHGRALAVATGAKLANHELTVLVTGGDGDGYGIGGNHFVHTARRNVDLTYLVMNNQIYGLTTGQVSPSSLVGMKTKSTPFGNVERPVFPTAAAIVNGATFVARGFSGNGKQLVSIIKQAIEHEGFSHVDVFSRERVKPRAESGHDPSDWKSACEKALIWGETIYTGVFYRNDQVPALHELEPILDEGGPIARRSEGLTKEQSARILKRMM